MARDLAVLDPEAEVETRDDDDGMEVRARTSPHLIPGWRSMGQDDGWWLRWRRRSLERV